jgi:hypothetical protein
MKALKSYCKDDREISKKSDQNGGMNCFLIYRQEGPPTYLS